MTPPPAIFRKSRRFTAALLVWPHPRMSSARGTATRALQGTDGSVDTTRAFNAESSCWLEMVQLLDASCHGGLRVRERIRAHGEIRKSLPSRPPRRDLPPQP